MLVYKTKLNKNWYKQLILFCRKINHLICKLRDLRGQL